MITFAFYPSEDGFLAMGWQKNERTPLTDEFEGGMRALRLEAVDYRDIVEYRFGTAMESKNDSILRKREWNMHRQNSVSVR